MAKVFVSVLIDTWNHERFIEKALSSVLAQDFPASDREILVVDDGSTDKTPEILRKFEPQIRVLTKPNGGQASAFNFGIPQCRGEIIAFLDGDDWWTPSKLSSVVAAFDSHPAVGLVGHSITEVFPDGSQRSELVRDSPHFRLDSPAGARLFRLRKSFLGTSRMAFRAELLRRIGPVPASLVFEADEFLFTLGALFSEVLLLREPLTFYRQHGQNLFQSRVGDEAAARRKLAVLCALADSLRQRFGQESVPADVADPVLESLQSETDVLRLSLGDGSRLDTVRVELRNFRISQENASLLRRFFKYASLLPALFLSPKTYASLKRKVAANSFYRKTRGKVLPAYAPPHVDRTGQWSSR